jgi:hypothetical protein
MKTKDLVWTSRDGKRETISQMETDHLFNLALFLQRLQEDTTKLEAFAAERDQVLPARMIQSAPLTQWRDGVLDELNKRAKKELKLAERILSRFSRS